jgi:RNA polymerase sigma-70 factor (ECF subfamily)
MDNAEQKRFINLSLGQMNPEDGLILTLYYLNENSIAEISEITTITQEILKMKLHRARKKMYIVLSGILKSEIKSIL